MDEARSRLVSPSPVDRSDWLRIYAELERAAGGSAFEIWLSALELVARDPDGMLLLVCPAQVRGWVDGRYGPLLDRAASRSKRTARLASDGELQVLHALGAASADAFPNSMSPDHQEAV